MLRSCKSVLFFIATFGLLILLGCADESDPALVDEPEVPEEPTVYVQLPPVQVAEGDGLPEILPANLKWVTNDEDPTFASPEAKRGGVFRTWMLSYPLTLRLVGPDSNGSFAGYLRYNQFSPVTYHPETRRPIPSICTHWAFGEDGRSIFYRINPAAKWSDGEAVTADDFVFAVQFMRSKEIVAPWYNNYYTERVRDVKKYDELTFGVQGADSKPANEMHANYSFGPKPKHFHQLSNKWLEEYNWRPQPTTGPYHVGAIDKGNYIDLDRTQDWWGDDLKYFKNRFNPDKVRVTVIRDENTAWNYFLAGELDVYGIVQPEYWHEKAQGEQFDRGYVSKYWYYNKLPVPSYGMYLNTAVPLLGDRNIRLGIAHSMNMQKVIEAVLRNDYERLQAFNLGFGDYDNRYISPRTFDLKRAEEHFEKAGFVERDNQGILIRRNDDGDVEARMSFRVTFGTPAHKQRLVVLKEEAKKAGVELQLHLLDSSASFKQMQEKKHEIAWMGWSSSGLSPRYWEHFHSVNANKPQTNNITNHANPDMDELIMEFRASSDLDRRIELAHQLERMVFDSAVFIPTFAVPYTREAAWRWVVIPEWLGTETSGSLHNTQALSSGLFSSGGLLWIDEDLKQETLAAKDAGEMFASVQILNTDHKD